MEKDWSWLRPLKDSKLLKFVPFEGQDSLCELVVHPSWPTLVRLLFQKQKSSLKLRSEQNKLA